MDNNAIHPKNETKMTYKENKRLDLALQFLEKRKFNYEGNIGDIYSVLKGELVIFSKII